MNVLIIEDDKDLLSFLERALTEEGFIVDTATTGTSGLQKAKTNNYNLIILDNHLPEKTGKEICQILRDAGKQMPILFLSVLGDISTKVELLTIGADDYLTKPFSFGELLARVHALLRRPQQMKEMIIEIGDITLDITRHSATKSGVSITLTPKEFALLECLMSQQGKVVSRTQLLEHVWGVNVDLLTNTLETHVRNLRIKIGDQEDKTFIHTLPGVGYRIE